MDMIGSDSPDRADQERLLRYAQLADTHAYAEALRHRRDSILARWLQVTARQPFHLGRPERAVSDDIPLLLDALIAALADQPSSAPPSEYPGVLAAARGHAQTRARQGLLPAEAVTEFRLLRQEIVHALAEQLGERASATEMLSAQMLLGDALDGAIGIAVNYFIDALEQAKDDFVAIAAHDLRTPLTVLKGTAQLLRRQTRSGNLTPDALLRQLTALEQEATRMDQLIRNLLDVTHVRAGRLEVHPQPTLLRVVVDRVVDRLTREASERIEIQEQDASLVGDWEESRIEQVLENLISNALKYAPSGPIHISLARDGDGAVLTVRDEGIGLSQEDQAQLFCRFYRSPEVIERKLEGTGLGLYICHGIVEAHGGQIEARSEGKGKGTTITVRLPLRAPAATSEHDLSRSQ